MQPAVTEEEVSASKPAPSLVYAWYVVGVLMLAYVISFVDRQIMALLIEPIRTDVGLTDTQFGLVHGLGFSLFYAIMGIPIARLIDHKSRPLIVFLGVTFWSLATAACGFARNFWHLLLARMCVGAGEATLSPATYSLLADCFPPEQLGRAVAGYSIGSFIGAGLAFLLGGSVIAEVSHTAGATLPLLGHLKPWQLVFVIVGLPGVLVAVLIRLTVRDAARVELRRAISAERDPGLRAFLFRYRGVFACHHFGYSMAAMVLFNLLSWSPAYLMRTYGLSPAGAAYILGPAVIFACVSGVVSSGWLMDLLRRRGFHDAPMRTGMLGAMGAVLPVALLPFVPSLQWAVGSLSVALFFAAFPMPPSTAAMQLLAPNRLRAQIAALFLFCNSLLGLALGSFLIGAFNDYVFANPSAIGSSLAIVTCTAAVIAACVLGLGRKKFVVAYRSTHHPSEGA